MIKQLTVFGLLGLSLSYQAVLAQPNSNDELVKRIEELERKTTENNSAISDAVTYGGTIEVEAFYSDSTVYQSHSQSDVVLSTVELGFGIQLSEGVSAAVTTLYEEDDTDLGIDVATIDAVIIDDALSLTLGQDYVPFGTFETYMVNDTLILEIAETRETVVMLGSEAGGFGFNVYAFNGDVNKNDTVTSFGTRLGYEADSFSVNIDYISNVADSDGVAGALDDGPGIPVNPAKLPSAVAIHALTNIGPITLIGEYLQTGEFSNSEWLMGADTEMKAAQLEVGFNGEVWNIAAAYQETEDALFFGLPESRVSVAASYDINENTLVSVELWQDEDYEVASGGTGERANSLVVQVAVNF